MITEWQLLYKINLYFFYPAGLILLLFKNKNLTLLAGGYFLLGISSVIKAVLSIAIPQQIEYDSLFTGVIIALFCFYMVHRILSDPSIKETYSYFSKVIFSTFTIYYFFKNIPFLRGIIILAVAFPGVLILKLAGVDVGIGGIDYNNIPLYWQSSVEVYGSQLWEVNVPITNTNVTIVLGCTGLREILIFLFAILYAKGDFKKKQKAFLISALLIVITNILRNIVVIYFTGIKDVSFDTTHHTVGSIMIFLALLISTIFTLFHVPYINSQIENLFKLKKISK